MNSRCVCCDVDDLFSVVHAVVSVLDSIAVENYSKLVVSGEGIVC